MAVAALSLVPQTTEARTASEIDLTGPPGRDNCAPCHIRIAESDTPGLIFGHGMHLVFACEACHRAPAHESGAIRRPGMDVCFACHGVTHPAGLLATAECSQCHTPDHVLRPKDHTAKWAGKPHAEAGERGGVNRCMMCHDAPKDCDACHREMSVTSKPMSPYHASVIPEIRDLPPVIVDPGAPTTVGQCVYCHADLDALSPAMRERLIFSHEPHLRQNYQCDVCHPEFGHGPETIRRPPMLPCYRCHGLVHSRQGLVATEECGACHPPGFDLKPPDHTKAFEKGEHKRASDADPEYCAMCHKPDFCVECHRGLKVLPDGTRSKPVIPEDHRRADWRVKHGPPYMRQEGSCGLCHDSPSCKRCHKTVMPHPTDWLKSHKVEEGVGQEDCYVCHTERGYCQDCHHDAVKRADLTEANCVPCHEEMGQKPPTAIKHKAFAEHAVHFDVGKKKDRPYVCDDCHFGFGHITARGQQTTGSHAAQRLPSAAHDLRLCYQCHGALDYRNFLIAPYRGAELCRRCHTDMRL